MEVVQELARQLGVAVENLLGAYAPYYLGAIIGTTTLSFIVFVVSIIVCVRSFSAMLNNYNAVHDGDNPNVWVHGIVSSIMFFIIIVALIALTDNVPKFIGAIMSPQGAAIADIVAKVMGVK